MTNMTNCDGYDQYQQYIKNLILYLIPKLPNSYMKMGNGKQY